MALRRGAKARDLGDECQQDGAKVSCNACHSVTGGTLRVWINRGSWKTHTDSAKHIAAVKSQQESASRAAQTAKQYRTLYSQKPVPLRNPEASLSQAPRPRFQPVRVEEDSNGISAADFRELMEDEFEDLQAAPGPEALDSTEILRREMEILQLQYLEEEFEGADDQTIPQLTEDFRQTELAARMGEDEDDAYEQFTGVNISHDYAPYGNKTSCYLDILDNLPRLRLSSSQLKMVLWIMKECGARDVPSFNEFRSMQTHIRKLVGVRSDLHKSDLGNIFYVNDIRDLIAKDFANPEVAPHINKYPEDVDGGPLSEIWQMKDGRWHNIPLDTLPPSILVRSLRYYIHEVAELNDGRWIIPVLWIKCKGAMYVDCRVAERTANCEIYHVHEEMIRVPLDDLKINHERLEQCMGKPIKFTEACQDYSKKIPNEFRKIDNGEDLFTVWVPVWMDDVSGARSKQYQKHLNSYAANANLPGQLLQQEYNVKFVSTSPHASALEQLKVVVSHVKSTHTEPIRTYDAETQRPCSCRLFVPDAPADNPQQAEEASHIGHQGNYFCRRCKVGGTTEERESCDGYHAYYEAGKPRNVEEIRNLVLEQIRVASYGVGTHVDHLQKSTGTKDKIAQRCIDILIDKAREMQAESPSRHVDEISSELLRWLPTQTDQPYNPLLNLALFDPSQDTLVEILHTILLGNEKYVWYDLHHNWTDAQRDLFTLRLQSTDLNGLRLPPIRAAYMMQYRNGLIGKHFKTLMQTTIFHIQDIATPAQFTLVRALGELGPMIWLPVIEDLDQYLEDLELLIGNVLDAFANIDPARILIKLKLHMLTHLPQDIRRRGPAVRFATEIFECFNAIFRLCSVLSNHQAPSRDIAIKLADLDSVKHILSGGYWLQDGAWVRGGIHVQRILRSNPIIQRHLGWAPPPSWTPGLVKALAQKKQAKFKALTADEALLSGAHNPLALPVLSSGIDWMDAVNVMSVTGDCCTVGSWGVFRVNDLPVVGRISKILLPKGGRSAQGIIVATEFEVGEALHPHYHMPVLLPAAGRRVIVPSNSIQFTFNVQHDCRACGCSATGTSRKKQERVASDVIVHSIVHTEDTRFIINTHAFHNAGLLRKFLPIALTKPRRLFEDRKKRHDELASPLAVAQKEKRAATQVKAAATREKNKAAREKAAAGGATRETEPRAVTRESGTSAAAGATQAEPQPVHAGLPPNGQRTATEASAD
ncbi:hypothetical protein FB45DRAFT_1108964 [Roridomyces roridus]|uniref:Uncharacterized protein n=1 Tax=Roridomyces roridus TaxID=1738132 RepID=A0AAD7BA43_9AGAR|nr:hypothetical protein FB45DRAFT_1108964 [Roridomyces roridus]